MGSIVAMQTATSWKRYSLYIPKTFLRLQIIYSYSLLISVSTWFYRHEKSISTANFVLGRYTLTRSIKPCADSSKGINCIIFQMTFRTKRSLTKLNKNYIIIQELWQCCMRMILCWCLIHVLCFQTYCEDDITNTCWKTKIIISGSGRQSPNVKFGTKVAKFKLSKIFRNPVFNS